MLFNQKILLYGILEAFNVHVVFVFCHCVILDNDRLHRFVCGICSEQSSSLRRVRYPGSAKYLQGRCSTEACAAV